MERRLTDESRTVLITGATDGIGLELARLHHRRRDRLLLVGRRPLSSLDDPLFSNCYVRVDLAKRGDSSAMFAALQGSPPIDRVYLNAGVGSFGPPEREPTALTRELLQVNVASPIDWTRRLLPHLSPGASIVFVSSIASALPCPEYATYAASKAAIDAFARELSCELQFDRRDVQITIARPGATHTGMHGKIGLPRERVDWTRFPPASRVARSIAVAVDRSRPQHSPGVANKAILAIQRWLPGMFDRAALSSYRRDYGKLRRLATPLRPGPCVITGFAQGIGLALAHRFAAAGHPIIGVDCDAERSEEAVRSLRRKQVPAWNIVADLSSPEECLGVVEKLRRIERPQFFIHNAGINEFGRFSESTIARQERVLALNLEAPIVLTQELLRSGWAADTHWMFISSLSHHVGYPGAAVYAASKAGLASFSRSLRASGRRSLTVYPGPTRTEHARRHSPDNSRESRRMSPNELADRIFTAALAEESELIPGGGNRAFALAGQLAPNWTRRMLARSLLKQRQPSDRTGARAADS